MRTILFAVVALAFIGLIDAASAGCLTGAAVGGGAGCAVGHHDAGKKKG